MFRVLCVERAEVRTHSAFLAELLDPAATHGQRHLFLRVLLERCRALGGDASRFPEPADVESASWMVTRERLVQGGKLDIVVESPRLRFLMVIENKIGASDQPEQLPRYHAWLQRQEADCRVLVYLTPDGRESPSAGGLKYLRLSYTEDVTACLRSALPAIEAPRVRDSVRQYLEIVHALCGKGDQI